MKPLLTKKVYHKMFSYKNGRLFWLCSKRVGQRAGYTNSEGYRKIKINKSLYSESRIIFTMFYGKIPVGYFIDHKDRNPENNKITNLRLATQSQNEHNSKLFSTNTSGFKGVNYLKSHHQWQARIMVNNVRKFIGNFNTPEAASVAYFKASKKYHRKFSSL